MVDFKDRVKEIRIARGYSQQGLADLMNVNKQTISQYERGVRFPDKDNLIALCDVLDVSADYLLGRTNINAKIICERI